MGRSYAHEEITAPIWEEATPEPPARQRYDEPSSGMRPRPMAMVGDVTAERPVLVVPLWLDEVLREPAIVVVAACLFGLAATGIAGLVGFLLGLVVG